MKTVVNNFYGGIITTPEKVSEARVITINGFDSLGNILVDNVLDSIKLTIDTANYYRTLTLKQYELINHLGNVLATVSDRLGTVSQDISNMKVMLSAVELGTNKKERIKTDLFDRETVRALSLHLADSFILNAEVIEIDLLNLTDLLEKHREQQLEQSKTAYQSNRTSVAVPPERHRSCTDFLRQPDLVARIDALLAKTGIVGEENTRRLLFIIASSYKSGDTLHALIHSESGSGKSHLLNCIGLCMPADRNINAYIIRKSVIANWLNEKKIPLEQVQFLAGHKWISATNRYRQTPVDEQRELINRFHPLNLK